MSVRQSDLAGVENPNADDLDPEDLLPKDAAPPTERKRGRPRGSKTKRRTTTRKAPSTPRPPSRKVAIRAMLEQIGNVWNLTEAMRGHVDPTCGAILVAQADAIATNLNTLAQQDEGVARWIDGMMMGGGWGSVALSVWPVVMSILNAHVMPAVQRRRELAMEVAEPEGPIEWPPSANPEV